MLVPYGFLKKDDGVESTIYDGASAVYSLRRPGMSTKWTNAVLRLRRSSDNATTWVFFDGSGVNDTITLNSFTGTETTPTATTLGAWVGVNNAFVVTWMGITDNDTIDSNKKATQSTTGLQPQFISSGVIVTNGGFAEIDFLNSKYLETLTANSDLDSTGSFTVFALGHFDTSGSNSVFMSTGTGSTSYINISCDRRTQKRLFTARNGGTFVFADLISQINSSSSRLLSIVHNATNNISYYNGTIQNTTAHSGLAHGNNTLMIGAFNSASPALFPDGIQEVIIFPSDKTTDIADYHTDINDYYSIY